MAVSSVWLVPPPQRAFRFEAFAVAVEVVKRPVRPRLVTPKARRYRTVLRQASVKAPDFAGHYRVVTWGCGTCCTEFAILDLKTGDAWFAPFFNACGYPPGSRELDAGLVYRPDSQLLVAVGANDQRDWGCYHYRWTGRELKLLGAEYDRNCVAAQQ
jgi:hypothetical protein